MFRQARLLSALILMGVTAHAQADVTRKQCVPKNNMARILKSPHPNDLAEPWTGESHIGTSSTFIAKRLVSDKLDGGVYLQGDLISPRGGVLNKNVYILLDEWTCTAATPE